jgi:hypothetical protein
MFSLAFAIPITLPKTSLSVGADSRGLFLFAVGQVFLASIFSLNSTHTYCGEKRRANYEHSVNERKNVRRLLALPENQ